MAYEQFRRGAHVIPLRAALSAGKKFTIKYPTDLGQCFFHAKAFSTGDVVAIKPRGSPNIWKVYQRRSGVGGVHDIVKVYEHSDEDVMAAWAALTL